MKVFQVYCRVDAPVCYKDAVLNSVFVSQLPYGWYRYFELRPVAVINLKIDRYAICIDNQRYPDKRQIYPLFLGRAAHALQIKSFCLILQLFRELSAFKILLYFFLCPAFLLHHAGCFMRKLPYEFLLVIKPGLKIGVCTVEEHHFQVSAGNSAYLFVQMLHDLLFGISNEIQGAVKVLQ